MRQLRYKCLALSNDNLPIRYKSRDVGDECRDVGNERRDVGNECRDVGNEYRDVGNEYRDVGDERRDICDQCLCCRHHSLSKTYQSTYSSFDDCLCINLESQAFCEKNGFTKQRRSLPKMQG
ncbi:hypothetical protein NIES2107_45830 [Nostoc carneum NIES-2107]|nr:hypothetical protein NIES2107_45830 [Nostoc carneum NIES-2107]